MKVISGERMKQNKVELLAPAGSFDSMKAAINAGADAVYIGGNKYGARAYADNLNMEAMNEAIDYVHLHGKSIYLTVNTLMKQKELEEDFYSYLRNFYETGMDAFIVQDIGALQAIKEWFPNIPVHASTQMNVHNVESALFLRELGVARIVTARELSLREIKAIKDETGLEIESFIHGALCYSYSGQCLLSSFLGGRSGNRGRCAQPCRLPYDVVNHKEKINRKSEQYVLSPKDMCTLDILPEIIEAGIDSLKIEGRMKKPEYTAGVVRIYRTYIDQYLSTGKIAVKKEDKKELFDLFNRHGFHQGYYKQQNGRNMITLLEPAKRAGNETLQKELKKYKDTEQKERIKGILRLLKDHPAQLTLFFRDLEVTVYGSVVEVARNQPIQKERIVTQMNKTGNTAFAFEPFEIVMDAHIFLPIQAINELRREALEQLRAKYVKRYRRTTSTSGQANMKAVSKTMIPQVSMSKNQKDTQDTLRKINVYLENPKLIKPMAAIKEISAFYLDSHAFINSLKEAVSYLRENSKKCYLALPYIYREEAKQELEQNFPVYETLLDGYLIRNMEEYFALRQLGTKKEFILDANVYTFNQKAMDVWNQKGIAYDTVPLELNSKELKSRGVHESEWIVYGYLPMMISAQCIHKTMEKCDKNEQVLQIKDRMKKHFYVKNCCRYCYNIIYNSQPLVLLDRSKEINDLSPRSVRLHFTFENKEEALSIVNRMIQAFVYQKEQKNPCKEFTRGHFNRGVE